MRKIMVIVNPIAGNGKALRILPEIKSYLNTHSDKIEALFKVSRHEGDIKEMASKYYDIGYREFIVVGGDGSLSELINGIGPKENPDVKIGVIPYGSGNDFIKSLYKEYKLIMQLRSIVDDISTGIDLGKVNRHYFINSCTFGVDGPIIKLTDKMKKRIPGKTAYYLSTLKEGIRFKSEKISVEIDNELVEEKMLLIAFNNGKYIGSGMNITPEAKLCDGYLEACFVKNISMITFLKNIHKVYDGRLSELEEVTYKKCRYAKIESKGKPYMINVDGTLVGETPAEISIIENAIRIFGDQS